MMSLKLRQKNDAFLLVGVSARTGSVLLPRKAVMARTFFMLFSLFI
jgi:hypothetical protein